MLTRPGSRHPEGDAGTTLAELVVCMCLTTIVGAIALGFFVWTGDATRATTTNSFANQNARSALTTAAGLLRLTVPGSVSPGTVSGVTGVSSTVSFAVSDTVTAGCGRRPSASVVLSVVSGTLTMTRVGPVSNPGPTTPCAYRATVTSTRVLAVDVKAGTGFTYAYRQVSGVTSTDPAQIGSIDIALVVAGTGGRQQIYTATAVVSGGGS